jgi:hypothetical protein
MVCEIWLQVGSALTIANQYITRINMCHDLLMPGTSCIACCTILYFVGKCFQSYLASVTKFPIAVCDNRVDDQHGSNHIQTFSSSTYRIDPLASCFQQRTASCAILGACVFDLIVFYFKLPLDSRTFMSGQQHRKRRVVCRGIVT